MLVERYPVVWVAATAGAGKTTAVVQAARAIERPVAWLTLDATDAAPGRLVTYLEAALMRCSPQVRGVGTGALARRIAHAEAAGLLAEAVGTVPVLLVIDELERLAEAPEALAALGGFVRYAPPTMRVVLVSRRELAVDMGNEATLGRVAAVGEGEADPLYGYLSSQILEQLDDDDRAFLVATSLLEEVTPAAAEALGQQAAGDRLLALRAAHLPVTWASDRLAMRCHTRFREFLLEWLRRLGDEHVRA